MSQDEPDPDAVTSRSELAAELTVLRLNADLTVRELARRINGPSATLGGYFSGRHLPGNAQLPLLRAALVECGVSDDTEITRWFDAVRRARTSSDRRVARPPAPYRGLHSYEPEHANLFFGRTDETQQILARVTSLLDDPGPSRGLLAVIGPSGSGKSSLLRAGVVAAIRGGALNTDRRHWSVSVTTPTADLAGVLEQARTGASGPTLVIVDQFEEIFTSVADGPARQDLLREIAGRGTHTVVILGMRADFYAEAAREPSLIAALQQAQVLVGPMSLDHVREAILSPAKRAGVNVEDGLADLVLADLAPRDSSGQSHDAGALPLLSHALLATWERSNGHRMTIADYRATGGLDAAVQRTAEVLFGELAPAEQDVARRLFLRLVHIDDDVAVTRRRVAPDELLRLVADGVDVQHVIDRFVGRRLITASDTSVEISHEALLSAWPRLREWVDSDRAGLRLHRQVTEAATVWDESGRDPAALLRGGRLQNAVEWAADETHRAEMDELEAGFIESGVQLTQCEAQRERRRGRRLRQLFVAVALLALLTSALAAYSLKARSDADRERVAVGISGNDARSREVAIESRELEPSDPALAQQLALTSYGLAPTPEARSAVMDRSVRPPMTRILGTQGPTPLAVSPDGRIIAVGNAGSGTVHLYAAGDRAIPVKVGRIPGAGAHIPADLFALAFSPDGRVLATGGQRKVVRLWDVSTPSRPRSLDVLPTSFTGAIQSLAMSPDGSTLAAASSGPDPVLEWDLGDRSNPRRLPSPRGIPTGATMQSVAFSADGRSLAAGGSPGVDIWPSASASTTVPRAAGSKTTVDTVQFDPSRPLLYSGDKDGVISVRSTAGAGLSLVKRINAGSEALVDALTVSPDGEQLAAGSSDNSVRQWSTTDWRPIASTRVPGPVTGVAYTPDGHRLLMTAADGSLRAWQAAERTIPISGTAFTIGYAANGSRMEVGTSGTEGVLRMWDTSDPAAPKPLGPPLAAPLAAVSGTGAIRADGRLVAAGSSLGQVELWDVSRPASPRALTPFRAVKGLVEQLAFSPDGRLLAVASDDHTVTLWDVHDPSRPRRVASMSGRDLMLNVAFSPDGQYVAGANADAHVYVWDVSRPGTPRRVAALTGFQTYAYGVAFSPDGTLLAAASADHTTRLWTMTDPTHPVRFGRPLVGPTSYVYSAAFSPDSRELAVASDDGTVDVYDLGARAHTEPAAVLRELGGNAYSVAFTPDGKTIVGGGRPGKLDLWTVDVHDVATTVCRTAGDSITRAEWAQYVAGAPYDPPCRNGKATI